MFFYWLIPLLATFLSIPAIDLLYQAMERMPEVETRPTIPKPGDATIRQFTRFYKTLVWWAFIWILMITVFSLFFVALTTLLPFLGPYSLLEQMASLADFNWTLGILHALSAVVSYFLTVKFLHHDLPPSFLIQ